MALYALVRMMEFSGNRESAADAASGSGRARYRAVREDGRLAQFVRERYASWDTDLGKRIERGKTTFTELETFAKETKEELRLASGRQEMLENLINEFL